MLDTAGCLKFVATGCAGLFSGVCLHTSAAEHPAWMTLDTTSCRLQLKEVSARATAYQVAFSTIGPLSAVGVYMVDEDSTSRFLWLAGGGILFLVMPWSLLCMNYDVIKLTDDVIESKGLNMRTVNPDYKITCECGIVTKWKFYARKAGTVIFYILSVETVLGKTSINVPSLSADNYFEVPLSRDMWISVREADNPRIGFFTSGEPMITYGTTSGRQTRHKTLQSELNVGDTGNFGGNQKTNRAYAVAAYVETAHSPMFTNLPYATTIYSHQTGTILTVSATDLDPDDVSGLTFASVTVDTSKFSFTTGTGVISYHTVESPGTYTVEVSVDDGCNTAVTSSVVITILNEGPEFTNLPASTTVSEDQTAATTFTIQTTDASGDTVTCSLDSVNPTDTSSIFSITSNEIRQKANPGFDFDSVTYYDLRISCTDGHNTIYSNYVYDIVKNEPPAYNAGAGFLPAYVAISSANNVNIYTLSITDPEGDSLSYSTLTCVSGTCPFAMTAAGVISTDNDPVSAAGYDLQITVSDNDNTVGPYILSVLVSVDPRSTSNNAAPVFTNLGDTVHVMENTAVNTYLYKLLHTDANPSNTFTYTKTSVSEAAIDTFFSFDASTQKISTSSSTIDFETLGTGGQLSSASGLKMVFEVDDGTATATFTLTFSIENVNEGPTITIGTTSLSPIDEGPKDTLFPDPTLGVTDIDTADTHTWSMSCGSDSKYFYLNTANLRIYLAREYDMDSGLSGSGTCVITVTDAGGMSDSGTVTLTVTNVNDNTPKLPYNSYSFVLATSETFFTTITDLAATDGDVGTFGTAGGITYAFGTAGASVFFQIDAAGVLYVRDVSSFNAGDQYVFQVTATDSGGLVGSCSITIVFSTFSVITTTTTERNMVFMEDYLNPFWLLLVGLVLFSVLVVVCIIVWNDPTFNEWMTFKMFRLSEICREKPKEPKRSLVHPAKLTVTVNNRTLEQDPDNAMPWELLAKDANGPEVNEVQERIRERKEKQDKEYLKAGLPVFERGKGPRPASSGTRPDSESPKYAKMNGARSKDGNDPKEDDDGGEGQWGDLNEKRVPKFGSPKVVVPVDVEPPPGGVNSVSQSADSEWGEHNSRTRRHSLSLLNENM